MSACAEMEGSDEPLFVSVPARTDAGAVGDGGAPSLVGAGFDAASIGTAAVQPPWGGGSAATDGALPAAPWQYDAAAPFSPSTPSATPVDGGAGAGIPAPADAGPAPTPPTPPTTAGAGPVLPPISGACPAFKTGTISAGGLSGISIQVGEKKPSGGSLIFYWHGTGSSAGEVNIMMPAAVRQEILAQGGIIVSPQSSLRTGGDCSGTSTFSKDDFKVADLIAACAVRDHNIDSRRIYTTGCSAGGLQAGCMASLRSSYVAAAVPNSGGITFRQTIQDPKHVPALMTMHGGASDWVAVSFSQTSKTLDTQFKQAGGFVVNCDHGGGHCRAPSALYSAGWEFMKSHPFGTSPSPYASGLTSSFPSYCKPF